MRLSTICPLPAGSAIFRDARCWHGGTPNLSREVRAMPNVEYFAPWFRSEAILRSMSYEQWQALSPHAQRICRYVVCDPGETVVGAGYMHPRARCARTSGRTAPRDGAGRGRGVPAPPVAAASSSGVVDERVDLDELEHRSYAVQRGDLLDQLVGEEGAGGVLVIPEGCGRANPSSSRVNAFWRRPGHPLEEGAGALGDLDDRIAVEGQLG